MSTLGTVPALLGQALVSDSTPLSSVPLSAVPTVAPGGTTATNPVSYISQYANQAKKAATPASGVFAQLFGGQSAAFLVGLILIVGGIFLFRPVTEAVVQGAKAASNVAKGASGELIVA